SNYQKKYEVKEELVLNFSIIHCRNQVVRMVLNISFLWSQDNQCRMI
ncbi:hypothetical protein NPIL_318511, partial [Nephila pilipes]